MYAISFTFDKDMLQKTFDEDYWYKAFELAHDFMYHNGFDKIDSNTYIGVQPEVNAVHSVLTVTKLSHEYPWFMPSVKEAKLFRIEEVSDLMPAIL